MAATTVDTLLVRIEADMSGIRRDLKRLEQNTQSSTRKIQSSFAGLSRFIGPAIGVATVVATGKAIGAVTSLASHIEEMQAKSSVVFGRFAEGVRTELGKFADEANRSVFELEEMAASIQDTFVPMGFARGEAASLSIQLTKLATDVASFNNASDTETMAAFQSALVGNHETVRRFGVVITEATLQQELLRMGINKSAKEITNAEKVQARLNLLLAGTTDAQGDAIKTSGSFANEMKGLQGNLKALGIEIGQELLPTMTGLVKATSNATRQFMQFLHVTGLIDRGIVGDLQAAREEVEFLEKGLEAAGENIQGRFAMGAMADLAVGMSTATTVADEFNERLRIARANFADLQTAAMFGEDLFLPDLIDDTANSTDKLATNTKELEKVRQKLIEQNQLLTAETRGASEAELEQIEVAQKLGVSVDELDQEIKDLIINNATLQNVMDMTTRKSEEKADALDNLKDSLSAMREETVLARLANSGLTEVQKQVTEFILENKNATSAQIEEFQKLAQETFNLKQNNEVLTETEKELATTLDESTSPALQRALDFVNEMNLGSSSLRELQLGLIEAFMTSKITLEEYESALEKIRESQKQTVEELQPLLEELKGAMTSMSASISKSLADMVVEGDFSLNNLQNIFESFVKRMIAKALELLVINKIMNSAFSAMTGGGSLGLPVLPFPKFASGGAINGKASGGAVRSPVLVGERGPELFVPNSAGVIRNAHDTRGMMRGGGTVTINQTLNVETGVAQTVRSELANFAPILKQDTIRAVMEARRRGGQFANAFGG